MTIMEWAAAVEVKLALAGTAGSIVSVVMGYQGVAAAFRVLTVGTLSAVYLGPLVVPFLEWAFGGINIPKDNAVSISGFLVGLVNVSIVEVLKAAVSVRLEKLK